LTGAGADDFVLADEGRDGIDETRVSRGVDATGAGRGGRGSKGGASSLLATGIEASSLFEGVAILVDVAATAFVCAWCSSETGAWLSSLTEASERDEASLLLLDVPLRREGGAPLPPDDEAAGVEDAGGAEGLPAFAPPAGALPVRSDSSSAARRSRIVLTGASLRISINFTSPISS
jgi:hypothetical protein